MDEAKGTNHLQACIEAASRPNGSINTLEFERRAESVAAMFIVERTAPSRAG
jgi:hypothetical protein